MKKLERGGETAEKYPPERKNLNLLTSDHDGGFICTSLNRHLGQAKKKL